MSNRLRGALALFPLLLAFSPARPIDDAWTVPLQASAFEFVGEGHRFESYRGRDALFIEAGRAWVAGSEFLDGTIEFDLAISEGQAFSGVYFRGVDLVNAEHFYVRHHLSGMPDASQYTPVYNGLSGWQIYAGPGFTAPIELTHDRWMHVRVDVNGDRAAVYVDSDEPSMIIDDLQREPATGRVGVNAGNAYFANLTIRAGSPTIPPAPAAPAAEETGVEAPATVPNWRVSNAFPESVIEPLARVDADTLGITNWTALDATHRGIANLARVNAHRPDNTVVAAVTLRADADLTARVRFGFSDRVRVFLNGRLLYTGSDVWRSRDYRFLGTIGLHDEVALPLEAGDNEVWFAVSEQFGGWGISASVVPMEGVSVVE